MKKLARFCPKVSGISCYDFPLVNVADRPRFRGELEPFKG